MPRSPQSVGSSAVLQGSLATTQPPARLSAHTAPAHIQSWRFPCVREGCSVIHWRSLGLGLSCTGRPPAPAEIPQLLPLFCFVPAVAPPFGILARSSLLLPHPRQPGAPPLEGAGGGRGQGLLLCPEGHAPHPPPQPQGKFRVTQVRAMQEGQHFRPQAGKARESCLCVLPVASGSGGGSGGGRPEGPCTPPMLHTAPCSAEGSAGGMSSPLAPTVSLAGQGAGCQEQQDTQRAVTPVRSRQGTAGLEGPVG